MFEKFLIDKELSYLFLVGVVMVILLEFILEMFNI